MRQRQSGVPGVENAPTCILAPPPAPAAAGSPTPPPDPPASALAPAPLALGLRRLDLDLAAVQLTPVELGHGLLRLLARRHLHEPEALRAPGHLIGDDGGRGHRSGLGEEPLETVVRGAEAESADEELLGHGLSPVVCRGLRSVDGADTASVQ